MESVNAGLGVSWMGGGPVRATDFMKSGASWTWGTGGAQIGAKESEDSENSATFALCSGARCCSRNCGAIGAKSSVCYTLSTGASNSLGSGGPRTGTPSS